MHEPDIGCGHAASTILMAQAYPALRFIGFDYHGLLIEKARIAAQNAGLTGPCDLRAEPGGGASGHRTRILSPCSAVFMSMGDPPGTGRHVQEKLASNGTRVIVEPFVNDELKDNLNPMAVSMTKHQR